MSSIWRELRDVTVPPSRAAEDQRPRDRLTRGPALPRLRFKNPPSPPSFLCLQPSIHTFLLLIHTMTTFPEAIGILSIGEMGLGIAQLLIAHNYRVLTYASDRR